MKRSLIILIMTVLVGLSGGGFIHTLHIAAECGSHAECQPAKVPAPPGGSYDNDTASLSAKPHEHDSTSCAICRSLFNLKSFTWTATSNLSIELRPVPDTLRPARMAQPLRPETTASPRAPPAA